MFPGFPEGWNKGKWYDGTDFDQQIDFEITIYAPYDYSLSIIAGSAAGKDFSWTIMLFRGEKPPLYTESIDFYEFEYNQIPMMLLLAKQVAKQVTKGLKWSEKLEDNSS